MAVVICGHPMRRYEIPGRPVLDDPSCGRRPGHPGRHISEAALKAARERGQGPSGSAEVAEAIRRARAAAGLTQRRLAAAVSVTEVCVQLWERAERMPGPERWEQLELTLGPLGIVREAGREQAASREQSSAA